MRLDDLDPSENVRDLGRGGGGGGGFPLLGLLPMVLGRGMGCGGIAILGIIAVAYFMFSGGLPTMGTSAPAPTAQQGQVEGGTTVCNSPERLFACRVLRSTELTWEKIFQASGQRYAPPTLNFFSQSGQSGCGAAQAAMGPFYCPSDRGVYLDTDFFRELSQRFGAAGDFAQAYVIAHEVGHHVQTVTGTAARVREQQASAGETAGNALQVKMELQADCYAGVWAAMNRDRLEPGDVQEGMTAANAIGDDTLQRQAQGRVVPESFTHGSSAQRKSWLNRGLESGNPEACDTFAS